MDDETLILETVAAMLKGHGYRVLTAADGKEALAAYRQDRRQIQAVVLDMMMPVMDGPTHVGGIDENWIPKVRIIATSGLRPTGWLMEAIASGQIPFSAKAL